MTAREAFRVAYGAARAFARWHPYATAAEWDRLRSAPATALGVVALTNRHRRPVEALTAEWLAVARDRNLRRSLNRIAARAACRDRLGRLRSERMERARERDPVAFYGPTWWKLRDRA